MVVKQNFTASVVDEISVSQGEIVSLLYIDGKSGQTCVVTRCRFWRVLCKSATVRLCVRYTRIASSKSMS